MSSNLASPQSQPGDHDPQEKIPQKRFPFIIYHVKFAARVYNLKSYERGGKYGSNGKYIDEVSGDGAEVDNLIIDTSHGVKREVVAAEASVTGGGAFLFFNPSAATVEEPTLFARGRLFGSGLLKGLVWLPGSGGGV